MKRLSILFAGMALAAVAAGPASAATSTVTGTVTAGSLGIATSATPTFGVTLDGTDQVASYTVPTTVTDATGSSSGWNLTITSTQFTTGSLTLATTASSVTGVSNSCVGGSTCTDPTNGITYALTVPAGSMPPTPVKYPTCSRRPRAGRRCWWRSSSAG
jgi:hypothetical protein